MNDPPAGWLCLTSRSVQPIQTGQFHQSFVKVSDQAANQDPFRFASQFDLPMTIDPQDGIAANAGVVQLLEVDLAFVDDIKQSLSGQFDELRSHVLALVVRYAVLKRLYIVPTL